MPQSAIQSGAADYTFTPADIARELGRISMHPFVHTRREKAPKDASIATVFSENEQASALKLFAMLRNTTGVSFTHYKTPTVKRRISRRMVLHKIENLSDYVKFVQTNPEEIDALFQDLLINVTEFFRDRETFEQLKRYVFPAIVQDHADMQPVRIWSAGCSTGEEAYSLAISLVEYLDSIKKRIPIQIFGSDLSEQNIEKARSGIYPLSIETDVNPERLRKFFTKTDGHYQIKKSVRDMCIFAKQDLIKDPPFSQLDMISCRNVLIYLENPSQKRILPIFHYALKPSGILLLGKSEGVGEYSDLFTTKNRKHKIYVKKISSIRPHFKPFPTEIPTGISHITDKREYTKGVSKGLQISTGLEGGLSRNVDRILLSAGYVPPSVVIDENLQIVQFRGNLSPYLKLPTGKATWNLLKMTHEELMTELRTAVQESKSKQMTVMRNDVMLSHDNPGRSVSIEVIPLKREPDSGRHFLVVFRQNDIPVSIDPIETKPGALKTDKAAQFKITKLERELVAIKEHLRSSIEEEQNAREEFQSVNEEVVSSNEELQSTNEELETAKEELQSTNEELVTVNEELQTRNNELGRTNNDLNNILSSSNVPIVIVDRELRIRRATPIAEKSLRIIPSDIGRSIADIKLPIRFPDLRELLIEVIDKMQARHQEVEDEEGRWHTLWVRPYRTWDNKIDGAVITFIDIDEIKRGQAKIEQSLSYAQGILSTMREPLIVLDKQLHIKSANVAFYDMFQLSERDVVGVRIYELHGKQLDTPQLRDALEKILPQKASFQDIEASFTLPGGERKVMYLNGHKLVQSGDKEELILVAMQDITDHRLLQERNDTFVSMASHELKTPVTTVKTLVQILQKRFESGDDKMLNEYLARMSTQIEQLSSLVTDLLDISKIRAGKIELIEGIFDVDQTVKEIVENYRLLSKTHEIVLTGDCHAKVKGDRDRVGQVLINLIVNAIKYSPKASQIIVNCSSDKKEITISVQDYGIGIQKLHQSRIFERFYQVENAVGKNFSGLGMGLYIASAIVTRHGGKMDVQSSGKGSTFSFTLPIYKTSKDLLKRNH